MFGLGINYNEEPEIFKRGSIQMRLRGITKKEKKAKKKEEKKMY